MATLTIRNIEPSLKGSLRRRAASHGRSMEEEARQILRSAMLREQASRGIATSIADRFKAVGGVDLPEPRRSLPRRPPAIGGS